MSSKKKATVGIIFCLVFAGGTLALAAVKSQKKHHTKKVKQKKKKVKKVKRVTAQIPTQPQIQPRPQVSLPLIDTQKRPQLQIVDWPFYGNTVDRNHSLPASRASRPGGMLWRYLDRHEAEFSPIVVRGVLYQNRRNGDVVALDTRSGRRIWSAWVGTRNASAPAFSYSDNAVVVTMKSGQVAALDARTGRYNWRWNTRTKVESSPVVVNGIAYFGTSNGLLLGVDVTDGKVVLKVKTKAAIKSAPAYANGKLYFGDYSGVLYALDLRSGRYSWTAKPGGELYSSPAVANGWVYVGSTNGDVFAYDATYGSKQWSIRTNAPVYASPAIFATSANAADRSVLVGSYSGYFYSLNGATGAKQWTYKARGRISGAASVISKVVYFADLGNSETIGLNVSNRAPVFRWGSGSFDPVISDGEKLYLNGWKGLWAFKLVP